MKTLQVQAPGGNYPIYIGAGLISDSGLYLPYLTGRQVMVVSNETVAPLYLEPVTAALGGKSVEHVVLPDGEAYKTLDAVASIVDALLTQRFSRNCTLVALGGGVVGDITGFAAACYQRGVAFVQVPTTLLAQVDSSVGGKTGVNHPRGKNMIGAFHQPVCVIADIRTLDTLPDRELRAGIAEIIKYGLICDAGLFAWLEQNIEGLLRRAPESLAFAIERSCLNKAKVVGADEKEAGLRAVLNLGHTFGHAIETACGYGVVLHGEAVAVGMCLASELSARLGWLDASQVRRAIELIERAGLPTALPGSLETDRILELMAVDKKNLDGELRLILLRGIGQATLPVSVSAETVRRAIDEYPRA